MNDLIQSGILVCFSAEDSSAVRRALVDAIASSHARSPASTWPELLPSAAVFHLALRTPPRSVSLSLCRSHHLRHALAPHLPALRSLLPGLQDGDATVKRRRAARRCAWLLAVADAAEADAESAAEDAETKGLPANAPTGDDPNADDLLYLYLV
jgi:hypothetical protein